MVTYKCRNDKTNALSFCYQWLGTGTTDSEWFIKMLMRGGVLSIISYKDVSIQSFPGKLHIYFIFFLTQHLYLTRIMKPVMFMWSEGFQQRLNEDYCDQVNSERQNPEAAD